VPPGYQFQVLAEPEDEVLTLIARMVERMRRALAVIYLVKAQQGSQIADRTACGRIDWYEAEGGLLLRLVIDGQEVPRKELGRMRITFESWQFRVEIRDRSEEV